MGGVNSKAEDAVLLEQALWPLTMENIARVKLSHNVGHCIARIPDADEKTQIFRRKRETDKPYTL